jgi:UPF0755 protein
MRFWLPAALLVAALAVTVTIIEVRPTTLLQERAVIVEIPPNMGLTGIAQHLEAEGAVRRTWTTVAVAMARGVARRLKAGEYEFPRGASTIEVVRMLESGRVRQHPVLHPEGATVRELATVLEAARLARADDVLRVANDPAFLRAQNIEGPSAEGYLFPDTYQFVRGMKPEEMLGRMVQRTRTKLTPEILTRAKARGLSVHQMLTLASIIEREAVVPEERRLIAAVFWNRLRIEMPLQADPTVQYALAKERRTLTRADLAADHPYNTYRNSGLPPGPIASPGLGSIEAALDPAPVKYLYFVVISGDGRRHHFSTTVEEHNAAVTRYRLSRQ